MKHKNSSSALRIGILIGFSLIAALPLLNIPPWFAPPDWGKIIVFQTVLAVFGVSWVLKTVFSSERNSMQAAYWREFFANPLALSLIMFLAVFLLAAVWSASPWFSFWGSPYRSGGFLNLASFGIFALLIGFILKKQEWSIVWIVSFTTAFLVGLIALFQQYRIFDWIFIPSASRPPSTVGGSTFLGLYLVLNSLAALSFGFHARSRQFRIFTLACAAFSLFVAVFIALSRAAMLGAFAGLIWFFLAYPNKKQRLTIAGSSVFAFGIALLSLFYFKPDLIPSQPLLLRETIHRVISIPKGEAARQSAWTIAWKAFKEKPWLGYGPENFAIGFDKFYDPALPQIAKDPEQSSSWWDRGHNIFFDLGLQAGVFGIAAFLFFLGSLVWILQKIKAAASEYAIHAHGMQSALAAYFIANLFGFDNFSTFLMLFTIAGYTVFLRQQHLRSSNQTVQPHDRNRTNHALPFPFLKTAAILFGIVLLWVFWKERMVPLRTNTNINLAMYYAEHQRCPQALQKIESALAANNALVPYARLKYTDVAAKCEGSLGPKHTEVVQKAYELMKENVRVWPTYTRNWIFLGRFAAALADKGIAGGIPGMTEQKIQELVAEAHAAFEKAHTLSPKRQEVYVDWVKIFLTEQNYQEAKKKAEECLELYDGFGECWWMKGLAELYLGEQKQFEQDRITASERNYNVYSPISLSQLVIAYTKRNDKARLADTYEKMAQTKPDDAQVLGILAWLYRDLKQYDKARETALKLAEINPEAKEEVSRFLQTLR